MKLAERILPRQAALCAIGGVALALAAHVGAAETGPVSPGQTTALTRVEAATGFLRWNLAHQKRVAPFDKEPEGLTAKPVRGTFLSGADSKDRVAFIWDRAAGRLYVDLNRNSDLADDPTGPWSSSGRKGSDPQVFQGVPLPSPSSTGGGETEAVNLTLYGGYGDYLYALVELRSFLEGRVALDGQEWQVGIFENRGARGTAASIVYLLLRPWADREKPFQVGDGVSPVFVLSTNLFLNGRAYELVRTAAESEGAGAASLRFVSRELPLGEVRIAGQFIGQLAWEGGPCLVVLDRPSSTVKIPVGRYGEPRVRLSAGETEAYPKPGGGPTPGGLSVGAEGVAMLEAGGPLTNSVTVDRQGRILRLDYQLLGAGGRSYQVARRSTANPPEFAVYRDQKQVASGKFEFG